MGLPRLKVVFSDRQGRPFLANSLPGVLFLGSNCLVCLCGELLNVLWNEDDVYVNQRTQQKSTGNITLSALP